jgi:hypothetical protein
VYTRSVVWSLSPSDVVTVEQVCNVYCNGSAQRLLEAHGGCIPFDTTVVGCIRSSTGYVRGLYEVYSFVYSIPILYNICLLPYTFRSTRSSLEFSVRQMTL